jgi:DNA polymerase V
MTSVASVHNAVPKRPFTRPLFLSLVPAGFPSPADDHLERDLDLHELLIQHPAATFYVRLAGDSMKDAGLYDGDILVVDRSVQPEHGHIVVAVLDGELTVKRLFRKDGKIELKPENAMYPAIEIAAERDFLIWGVVTGSIRQYSK